MNKERANSRQPDRLSDAAEVISVPAAAKVLGTGRNTMYRLIKTGEVKVIRFGRRLMVPRRSLEEWLQRQLAG